MDPETRAYVDRIVAAAPPLSLEQIDVVRRHWPGLVRLAAGRPSDSDASPAAPRSTQSSPKPKERLT